MKLLAIDPASHKTGIAIFNNGSLLRTETLETDAKTPLARRLQMAELINSILKFTEPDLIISEEPMLQGRNNNGMARLLGYIEYLTRGNVVFIHPSTVKKAMGHGGKDKLEIALAAGRLVKTEKEQDLIADLIAKEAWDETDAVAIALTHMEKMQ